MDEKQIELENFKITLADFWGEEPTKRGVVQAWKDYVDLLEDAPEEWKKLTKEEKEELYEEAGLL